MFFREKTGLRRLAAKAQNDIGGDVRMLRESGQCSCQTDVLFTPIIKRAAAFMSQCDYTVDIRIRLQDRLIEIGGNVL